jgi:hypothetical protein
MKASRRTLLLLCLIWAAWLPSSAAELTISGTRFQFDGKPFPYTPAVRRAACLTRSSARMTARRLSS